jgi:hypothetical protein
MKIKGLKNQIRPTNKFGKKVEFKIRLPASILGTKDLVEEAIFMRSSWLFEKINFASPHHHSLSNPQPPNKSSPI